MRISSQLFVYAALLFGTVAGVAQDKGGEQPAAPKGTNAPLDFGFPRPEKFPDPTYRDLGTSGGSTGRTAVKFQQPLKVERQSAGRLITVEVIVAETPVVGNSKEMTAEKIAELEKAGKLISQSRCWVSLVENQRSQLQFGERVSVVVGRVNVGGRGMQESMAYENVGTKLSMVGRIDGDSILVQMELDQTRLIPPPAKADGDAGESVARPHTATTSYQSTLTIPPGKTVVAGGKETQTENGKVQTWLLVSANSEGAKRDVGGDTSPIRIFRLINAKAESLAPVIQGIFREENVQIAVDARTNSLIVRGDAKSLDLLRAILSTLDEADLEKK
ncbi:MAG: secretin N-terminal domain-containing protein [Pirellulaceae bacterium]